MKIIKRLLVLTMCLLTVLCVSCTKEETYGPYGKRIEEDLTSTNIIDDNYRNYYEIYVGAFRDTNGDGWGDLQGVISKLDYIKELGYNGIWLMPINQSYSYHKYDVHDYYAVDNKYGTMEDLEQLISECHNRGIKLILDLVLNHSSSSNKMFINAKKAYEKNMKHQTLTEDEEKYKDFYTFYAKKSDIPGHVIAYEVAGKGYYYEGNFSSGMPEFNCDSPYVREEFQKIMKFYLDKGIDGFRLDAVKYFYLGDTQKNVELLSKIKEWATEINPNAYIVGECWDSASLIGEYYKSGVDSFFNFSTSVTDSASPIINSVNLDGKMLNRYYDGLLANITLANGYIPAPFLNNHDTIRFTSENVNSTSRTKFLYGLLQMMNGSTFTYYGDEVGMVGSNSGDSPDQNVRIAMKWGEEGVTDCNNPYGTTIAKYPHGTVKEQMENQNSIYNYYKKCLLLRNQNPEIARGEVSLVHMDREGKILFIKKTYNGSEIGIIFNFSLLNNITVDFQSHGFSNVVGQLTADISEECYIGLLKDNSVILPPYSIAIVK